MDLLSTANMGLLLSEAFLAFPVKDASRSFHPVVSLW